MPDDELDLLTPELLRHSLNSAYTGFILLDFNYKIIFWNSWLESHSGIKRDHTYQKTLEQVFPETRMIRLKMAITHAISKGMASILSQSINQSPLPLFKPSGKNHKRIQQTIYIRAISTSQQERYCLIQIADATAAVNRETLLRKQTTDLQKLADQFHTSEKHTRAIFENLAEAIIVIDNDNHINEFNQAALSLFPELDSEKTDISTLEQLFPEQLLQQVKACPFNSTFETTTTLDHQNVSLEISKTAAQNHGDTIETIILLRNISKRSEAEAALFREKEFAQVTLDSITEAVLTTDINGYVTYINKAGLELLDCDQISGIQHLLSLIKLTDTTTQQTALDHLEKVLATGEDNILAQDATIDIKNRLIDIDTKISALRNPEGNIIGATIVIEDVSNERYMRNLLSYQATHDDLTGLINRREFKYRLKDLLHRVKTDKTVSVLGYLDLDQFKIVNDTCGHQAGDLMLKQLSQILESFIRTTDSLARLGGDEFAILLTGCSLDVAIEIAEKIREAIKNFRFQWDKHLFSVGVSIGIVEINEHWETPEEILSAADSSCYLAKERGRGRIVIFESGHKDIQEQKGQMLWASKIQSALEKNCFRLFCQPILPIGSQTHEALSWEILVRMLDKDQQIISPTAFIPAAERFDIMSDIDQWVISSLTYQWQKYPELFTNVEKISVNLSGQSLCNPTFLDFVINRIEETGCPWDKLCFEITETAFVSNMKTAAEFITTLKKRGARFSLDDFGSGLSSFAYLKHLPVDYLKIDGIFVKDILTDPMDDAMVKSICEVGKALGLKIIAEFVENKEIIQRLQQHHVDYAQGYAISKPIPLDQIRQFSQQHRQAC